jgi:hypothetical protein
LLLGLLVAFAGTLKPRVANARKKRVVVLPFKGRYAKAARRGVLTGLRRKVRGVSAKRYRNAADALGVDETSGEGMVAACSKARCDAVLKGSVRKLRRRRYKVTVTVYNGGTGEAIGRRAATVRGRRRVTRAGAAIARRCLRLIRKARYRRGAPRPAEPDPPPAPATPEPAAPAPVAKRTDTSDIPVFKPTRRKGRGDDDDDDDDDEAGRVTKGAKAGGAPTSLFEISVALGMSFRNYELVGTDPNIEPNKYDGGMYPEFTIHADIYPLSPFMKGLASGVGIGATYTRHLTISTKPKDNADQTVDTSSQEVLLDLKWRWMILSKATSPWATLFAGWGMRDFTLGANAILTSLNYRFFRIGLDGGVPLGTPLFAITAGFDVRPLMAVGQEAVDSFGTKSGGLGFSGRAGLSGVFDVGTGGILYFASFEYLRFSTDFAGLEPTVPKRPGLPDRNDPTSGSDRFIRLWLGVGYSY